MQKNAVTISRDETGENSLSITFGREDFQDFLTSLVSSRREERHRMALGFDIHPSDIKVLFQKIESQINSHYDCLSHDFIATIDFGESDQLTLHNLNSLTTIDNGARDDVSQILCKSTYMIGFNRENGKKSYDKQEITLNFRAGMPGEITITIISSDVSWPQTMMNFLAKETKKICRLSTHDSYSSPKRFLFLAPLFMRSSRFNIFGDLFANKIRLTSNFTTGYLAIAFTATIFAVGLFLFDLVNPGTFTSTDNSSKIYVYDQNSKTLVQTDIESLIDKYGWERAAELTALSREIARDPDIERTKPSISTPVVPKPEAVLERKNRNSFILGWISIAILFAVLSWRVFVRPEIEKSISSVGYLFTTVKNHLVLKFRQLPASLKLVYRRSISV